MRCLINTLPRLLQYIREWDPRMALSEVPADAISSRIPIVTSGLTTLNKRLLKVHFPVFAESAPIIV
jgi:hypothetical protein